MTIARQIAVRATLQLAMSLLLALLMLSGAGSIAFSQTAEVDNGSGPKTGTTVSQPEHSEPNKPLLPAELAKAVQKQKARIERLVKSIERERLKDDQLAALRPEIVELAENARRTQSELDPHLAAVAQLIEALGAKPEAGQPGETANIAAERERLNLALSELQSARKQARLNQVNAERLIARVQTLQLANLDRNLRERQPGPLSLAHWQTFWTDLPRFGRQVWTVADNWWSVGRAKFHWLILILLGAGILWWTLWASGKRRVRRWMQEPPRSGPQAYLARISMAMRALPFLCIPSLLTAGFLYIAFWASGLFNDQIDDLALSALKAVALYVLVKGLAKTILLPWEPGWRLIGLQTTVTRRYLWLTRLLAGAYCLDMWLTEAFSVLQVPTSISLTEGYIANLAFAGLLLAFVWLPTFDSDDTDFSNAAAEQEGSAGFGDQESEAVGEAVPDHPRERVSARLLRRVIYWSRIPATLAVIVIFVATLMGYLALGRFVAGQVMLIGICLAAVLLGHLVARALATQPDVLSPKLDDVLESQLSLSVRRRRQTLGVLSFLINLALILGAAAMLLISWGYSDAQLLGWAKSLIFGFEVGKFKFSLLQVLIALALFVGVILLTRLFQAWLSRKVLDGERVDRGIANSIHAGIGYAGVALAALIGVSYAGLDLSNIALIASALSIGIGFGLNAIASNFVSGLIMLIERPIKVGDWVVVGAHQGYVRRISVRATEIETFDRASVIIPNSDFMTNAVQNWTHRNAMGRVIVNIGASYNADPKEVVALLEKVASECDALLKYPAPSVHFEEFGASSLDFSVRGFIADVNTMLSTKTELRLRIAEAFKQANIEIPFPQQDVHLRDLDGVREVIGHAMAARAEKAAAEKAMAHGNDNGGKTDG